MGRASMRQFNFNNWRWMVNSVLITLTVVLVGFMAWRIVDWIVDWIVDILKARVAAKKQKGKRV